MVLNNSGIKASSGDYQASSHQSCELCGHQHVIADKPYPLKLLNKGWTLKKGNKFGLYQSCLDTATMEDNSLGVDNTNKNILSQVNSLAVCGPQVETLIICKRL